jgi:hypothetical protein
MDILVGGPRTGKTEHLLKAMKSDPNGIMIVSNAHIKRYFESKGIPPEKIFTTPESLIGQRKDCNLYIDNADRILRNIYKQKINMVTISKERDDSLFDLD